MRTSCTEGLHSSVWAHLGKKGEARRPGGARRARRRLLHGGADGSGALLPHHHDQCRRAGAAAAAARWPPSGCRASCRYSYDPSFAPAGAKTAVTLGMGMTEKQGGTDVRAATTTAEPVGGGGPGGEYRITGHKWFLSAPMSDAFLVLAQAPDGLTCFLMPRFLPDGSVNALRLQRLKDKLGNRSNASSEVEFHGAYARAIGEEGRGVATIIEMVTLHAPRLRRCLGRADALCAGQRHPPRRAPQRVRQEAHRAAADAAGAGRHGARRRSGDRARLPPRALVRSRRGSARLGLAAPDDAGDEVLGVQDRAGAGRRGDGVPRRQRLRRGGAAGAPLSRGAGQLHLGGLRQRHGARRGARAAARAGRRRRW